VGHLGKLLEMRLKTLIDANLSLYKELETFSLFLVSMYMRCLGSLHAIPDLFSIILDRPLRFYSLSGTLRVSEVTRQAC
jgi:hypothetical protein